METLDRSVEFLADLDPRPPRMASLDMLFSLGLAHMACAQLVSWVSRNAGLRVLYSGSGYPLTVRYSQLFLLHRMDLSRG